MILNLYKEFSLYLEGVKIKTFTSINISEQEGVIPAAQVTFAASSKILRILPGTVIQIFVKKLDTATKYFIEYLIFEGEITQMTYTKNGGTSVVSFRATSILGGMVRAKLRPSHVIVPKARADAETIQKVSVIIQNNINDEKGKPLLAKNQIKNSEDLTNDAKVIEGTIDQLGSIAEFGSIANDLLHELVENKKSQAHQGNFFEFFKEMFKFFIQSDIYYGIQSISYKLNQSIFVLPNPKNASGFKMRVFWEAYNNVITEMSKSLLANESIHVLMNLLEQFNKFMGYKYIAPAVYPAAKYFHVKNSKKAYRPLRMIFMPDLDAGPPPLCNIFFPEQVSSISYDRDFMSEPTRVIGQMSYSYMDQSLQATMLPITVVPDVNLDQPLDKRVISKFTDEESFKGVVLKSSTHDGEVIKALYDNQKKQDVAGSKGKTIAPLSKSEMSGEVGSSLREFVLNDYLNLKYGQRAVQITSEWNPYRLIGLPAMVFELGKPTLIGVIQAISTSIQASGQASSMYVLRNCRIMFDEEEDIATSEEDKKELGILSNYLTNDFANGGFLGANGLMFNSEYYGIENIGKVIYPYLMNGTYQKPSKLLDFFKDMKDEKGQILYPNTADAKIDATDSFEDYSIMRFVDMEEFNKQKNINTVPQEVRDTKLMYTAVKEFKKVYKVIVSQNYESNIDSFTKRRLITKQEYLSSINSSLNLDEDLAVAWQFNSKDLAYILQNKSLSTEAIQTLIYNKYVELNNDVDKDLYNEAQSVPDSLIKTWNKEIVKLNKDLILFKKDKAEKESNKTKDTKEQEKLKEVIKVIDQNIKEYDERIKEITKWVEDANKKLPSNMNMYDKVRSFSQAIFKPFNVTRRAHAQEVVVDMAKNKFDNNINGLILE